MGPTSDTSLRSLLVGAPRPLLSRTAERRLGPRHRELLDGLEALFLERGFAGFTVGELADALGCSRRTLYEIAPSKEQLVLVVLDRFLHRRGRAALERIDPHAPVTEQLREYAIGGVELQLRDSLFEDLADDAPARRLVDRHVEFSKTVVERLVRRGIERGELRRVNPAIAAAVITGSSLYLNQPRVLAETGVELADAIGALLDLVLPGLVAPGKGTLDGGRGRRSQGPVTGGRA